MIDIDHFKDFNDTYGHATGDRVLQTVAQTMQDALRTTDICARHGGEEFVMLLPNTPGDNAFFVAERVRRTLGGTRYTGLGLPTEVNITISVGVATCPRDATALDELLELADKALYRAKAAGRDMVVLVWRREARAGQELTPRRGRRARRRAPCPRRSPPAAASPSRAARRGTCCSDVLRWPRQSAAQRRTSRLPSR